MAIDEDEKTYWHNQGQEHASEGSLRWCWAHPLESSEHYDERRAAYDAGYDNAIEQQQEDSGGCFLTSACVTYAGLPDNCEELMVLRRFRDTYVRNVRGDSLLIAQYYTEAPRIAEAIGASPDRSAVLASILATVRTSVKHVQAGEFSAALSLYGNMFNTLRARFLPT